VEPKYEKQLQTLDELLESDVVYGYHTAINYFQDTISYPEFVKFLAHKKLQEDCSDIRKCVKRLITQRDLACTTSLMLATYVAREMGTGDVGKVICTLDGVLMSAGVSVLFKKGNPLLDRFNILMRRYLEAGLLERLLTELQHRAILRGGSKFREATGDVVFAFSVSHLVPAFVVLLVGTILSSLLCFAELILNCLCKGGGGGIRSLGEY
jgi:hypothetical protein